MTEQAISPLRWRMIEDMSEDVRGLRLHLASSGAGTPKAALTCSVAHSRARSNRAAPAAGGDRCRRFFPATTMARFGRAPRSSAGGACSILGETHRPLAPRDRGVNPANARPRRARPLAAMASA
jgi:hypothetical protein